MKKIFRIVSSLKLVIIFFSVTAMAGTVMEEFVITRSGTLAGSTRLSELEWQTVQGSLQSVLDVEKGKPFDADQAILLSRTVERHLNTLNFIGGKVLSVTPQALNVGDAARVSVVVDPGDRVSFGFSGNERFNRSDLLAFIEDLRSVGFGRDYAQAIRERIEEEYRSVGYASVRVQVESYEKGFGGVRHLSFVVTEGARYRIDSVDFDGNHQFSADQLKELFFENAPFLTQKKFFVDREIEKASASLIDALRARGYLGARLVTTRREVDTVHSLAKITVYLMEGDQTLVRSANFPGAVAFSEAKLKEFLGLKEGGPLNLFAFTEGLETIKSRYRAMGFLEMVIENEGTSSVVKYSSQNSQADIEVRIREGVRFKVSRVEVEGANRVRENVIRREIDLVPGEVIEEKKISEVEAQLSRLGILSGVAVSYEDDSDHPDSKIVRFKLEDGSPGSFSGGVGMRNDLGPRVFGGVSYANLWQRNHTLSLDGTVNRRFQHYRFPEYVIRMSYLWPWFLPGATSLQPSVSYDERQFVDFDARTIMFSTTLSRRMLKAINLVAGLTYSLENVIQKNSKDSLDDGTFVIGGITPALKLDLRDNPLAPTQGLFASTSFEVASPVLGSQRGKGTDPAIAYTRFQFRADYHLRLPARLHGFLSFRTGFGRNLVDPGDGANFNPKVGIPLIKKFALGGPQSLRGYELQDLNPYDISVQGTMSFVNYRTQLDIPLVGQLGFSPFVDAGNVQVDTFSLGSLRYGAGFGFSYQTPVGPVNFGWGFKIDPPAGKSPGEFYFTLGAI